MPSSVTTGCLRWRVFLWLTSSFLLSGLDLLLGVRQSTLRKDGQYSQLKCHINVFTLNVNLLVSRLIQAE